MQVWWWPKSASRITVGWLLALASVGCGSEQPMPVALRASAAQTRIQTENALPGTTAFNLEQPAMDHEIEAYPSAVSGVAGDTIDLHVSVRDASRVDWQLFRLGYYAGLGAREVAHGGGVHVDPQPDCPPDAQTGLVECQWATAFSVTIGADFLSGYYLFKLTREDGFETGVPFVVREAAPFAPLLVQASTNTWQAYNRWGGTSLYHDAQQVSYDRPYAADELVNHALEHEIDLVNFLEQRGVEVAYTTNIDVDREPSDLDSRQLFVVSGHDEYWSLGERDALDSARDSGISLAILSANTGYWRVRLEPSSSGVDRRIITCYKSAKNDPEQDQPDTTARFRDSPHALPENELTGTLYQLADYPEAPLPLYVADPSHWLFDGTGVKMGDRIAVALGGEWDEPAGGAEEPSGVDIVLSSPALDQGGRLSTAAAVVYEPTDHNFVFSVGSEEFAHALWEPQTVTRRAERIMDNLLTHAGVADPNASPPLDPTPSTLLPGQVLVLAGTGKAGYRDGAGSDAEFNAPAGLALGPDGTLYVTESRNHDVRAIAPDGTVTTLAGSGPHGERKGKFANGSGTHACFDAPNGIAVNSDGVVFVADAGNNRIRAISNGKVTTYAGGDAGTRDGDRAHAQFSVPTGIAVGPDGSLFVIETHGSRLSRIDPMGQVTTLSTDLVGPTSVAVAPDGTVYMTSPKTGQIAAWTGTELRILTDAEGSPGESVSDDVAQSPLDAWLRPSYGLAFDQDRLVFSDMANDAIRELVFGSSPQTPRLSTLIPVTAPDDMLDDGQPAGLMLPRGIVPYGGGYAVADTGHHRIVVVKSAAALSPSQTLR
jgi:sugar lactone lactonase YvrE